MLHPGTAVPGHDEEAGRAFRAETGLTDQPLLLSVGRLTPRKGLAEFVRGVLPRIVAERPGTTLLVIGADARDALTHRTGSEQARIERAAQEAGVETAIRWMPPCDDATLARAYQAADVHVFPVRETPGDVEGFGMVAIEAAAHGTPTVAYAVGGVPDAVVEGRSGTLVSAGDEAAFARAVVELIGPTTRGSWRDRCVEAASAFAWDRFNTRLIDLIRGPLETPA